MQIVAAPDKFRSTAGAPQVAEAIANGCWQHGDTCTQLPLADGGEGMLDAFGGPNRVHRVTGPLGAPVDAGWRLEGKTAYVEMARASGLELVGGSEHNRPIDATTAGVGELIVHAVRAGAKRIVVGLGGSATSDGGLGALDAIANPARLAGVTIEVAYDVDTRFEDAAIVFGPQKGASPAEVALLTRRLEGLADRYESELGVDVRTVPGGGAAGGLAGGLLAFGATLVPGFDLIAEERGLDEVITQADAVITGEGRLDLQSFAGKVVGGVADMAAEAGVAVFAVVGQADADALAVARARGIQVASLVDLFGAEVAMREPLRCIEDATATLLAETL